MNDQLKFTLVLLVYLLQTKNSASNELSTFVSKLVLENPDYCRLFFVRLNSNVETVAEIMYLTQRENFNIYFSPIVEESIENGYNFPENTSSIKISFFRDTTKFHYRKSGQCFVVVVLSDVADKNFMLQIFNFITPIYAPFTRKDEDFYIFITPDKVAESMLLMNELPAKIKFKLAVSPLSNNSVAIRSVCFFCNEGLPTIVQFPARSSQEINYFPDFVTNLNGKTLRVSIPAIQSRIEVDPPYVGINNAKRGLWKNLFEDYLGLKFNFTYTMFMSTGKDGGYGGGGTGLQLPNGTWIGTVGDIYYGKAELGILASKTPKRIFYMDTSDSFFDVTYLTFVTAKGLRIYSPATVFWPFAPLMWTLIMVSTVVAFLFFKGILSYSNMLGISSETMMFARRGVLFHKAWGFRHQVQFIITSFLDQDCTMPTSNSLRCFSAFWLFFALVITSVYRSKLVTIMAFPITQKVPKSFEELAYSSLQVGFMKHGDSAYNTLAASTDPVYVKLISEMEVVTGVGLECLAKVVQSNYGCIAYEFSLKYLKARNMSDNDIRKLIFAPDRTYNIWTGLDFEGRSIFKKNFDKWLRLTRPMHLADMWDRDDMYYNVHLPKLKWWAATNQLEKHKKSQDESKAMSIKEVVGAFSSMCAGLVISLIIFVLELSRRDTRKQRFASQTKFSAWGDVNIKQ